MRTEQRLYDIARKLTTPGLANLMPSNPAEAVYKELRTVQSGEWALFLGAGASFDFGIPTMRELGSQLRDAVGTDTCPEHITQETFALLKILIGARNSADASWDIEQLLTHIHQLLEVSHSTSHPFEPTQIQVGSVSVTRETLQKASEDLVTYLAANCELDAAKETSHGDGSVAYLADFLDALAPFGRSIRVFTINIDQCIEAAVLNLAHRNARHNYWLVDGFDTGIVPRLDLRNYQVDLSQIPNALPVYYWKLHGSIDWTYTSRLPIADSESASSDEFTDESLIVRRTGDQGFWESLASSKAVGSIPKNTRERIVVFPTPAKYSQTYTYPYMDLFGAFRLALERIRLLIVVGTSFPDLHIRSAIRSFVSRSDTTLFVIDPNPQLQEQLPQLLGNGPGLEPMIELGMRDFVDHFRDIDEVREAQREADQ